MKLELGINAQKFIQQVQVYHGQLEEQISKGIELALKDVFEENNFVEAVRQNTKETITRVVNDVVISWETKKKITEHVQTKIFERIDKYADQIADKITAELDKQK